MRRLLALVMLAACHGDEAPAVAVPTATATPTSTSTSTATATATPTPTPTPTSTVTVTATATAIASVPPPPPPPLAVRHDACKVDADCMVSTFAGCCACCPSAPYATSKVEDARRNQICAAVDCRGCGHETCAPAPGGPLPKAACVQSVCTLR